MFFRTKEPCVACGAEVLVFPASTKMSKINERTLPGWKRCECQPYRFHEITRNEFDALAPGWEKLINPKMDEEVEIAETQGD